MIDRNHAGVEFVHQHVAARLGVGEAISSKAECRVVGACHDLVIARERREQRYRAKRIVGIITRNDRKERPDIGLLAKCLRMAAR